MTVRERGIIKGKRKLILAQLQHKFGAIPEAAIAKVQAMQTAAELTALSCQLLDAHALADPGLSDDAN
jgi:hypothetical protein